MLYNFLLMYVKYSKFMRWISDEFCMKIYRQKMDLILIDKIGKLGSLKWKKFRPHTNSAWCFSGYSMALPNAVHSRERLSKCLIESHVNFWHELWRKYGRYGGILESAFDWYAIVVGTSITGGNNGTVQSVYSMNKWMHDNKFAYVILFRWKRI